jgi:hypothetical protein
VLARPGLNQLSHSTRHFCFSYFLDSLVFLSGACLRPQSSYLCLPQCSWDYSHESLWLFVEMESPINFLPSCSAAPLVICLPSHGEEFLVLFTHTASCPEHPTSEVFSSPSIPADIAIIQSSTPAGPPNWLSQL